MSEMINPQEELVPEDIIETPIDLETYLLLAFHSNQLDEALLIVDLIDRADLRVDFCLNEEGNIGVRVTAKRPMGEPFDGAVEAQRAA